MNFDLTSTQRPLRVIQFGGGVFLRGFFDWMLQKANDRGVLSGNAVIVRSRTAGADPLEREGYRFTQVLRDADHIDLCPVNCIAGSLNAAERYEDFLALAENPHTEIIVSNTTEAGIVYEPCPRPDREAPASFPAKLTALLYRRYTAGLGGMLILPFELIEDNGDTLRALVLRHGADWALGEDFSAWVERECSFRNTLVDRIVSGAPAPDETFEGVTGTVNTGEYFHLLVIEGEEDPRLPFRAAGLNVKWVPSVAPWRTLKVRILNGAHTSLIPYAVLEGAETVLDCMNTPTLRAHLEACLGEILDSLEGDRAEAEAYAAETLRRFSNPYIRHRTAAIALHSAAKFRVRVLPSLLSYRAKHGHAPRALTLSLAKLLALYRSGLLSDDGDVMTAMTRHTGAVLADESLWGTDLSDLYEEVARHADPSLR